MTALLLRLLVALLRLLGPVGASNFAGWVTRGLGPLLPVHRVALQNLAQAMPELDEPARRQVARAAWENLGRTAGEFFFLSDLHETETGPGYEITGLQHLPPGGPVICFSGHLGNWELLPQVQARLGRSAASLYRPAGNKAVDALILRTRGEAGKFFPKGAAGARASLKHLANGGMLALLMDQKMNDGVAVQFFGRRAMTAPALAALALRFGCPVVPAYVQRLGPARLRVVVEQPLALPAGLARQDAVLALTQQVTSRLEQWIRAEPGSWLWMHRRWGNSAKPA